MKQDVQYNIRKKRPDIEEFRYDIQHDPQNSVIIPESTLNPNYGTTYEYHRCIIQGLDRLYLTLRLNLPHIHDMKLNLPIKSS